MKREESRTSKENEKENESEKSEHDEKEHTSSLEHLIQPKEKEDLKAYEVKTSGGINEGSELREEPEHRELNLKLALDYLEELRGHLLLTVIVFVLVFLAVVPFSKTLLNLLLHPFKDITSDFIFIRPLESFWVHVKISAYFSLVVSVPFFVWRIWLFVSPALYDREKRALSVLIFAIATLFVAGFLFGYFLVLPVSIRFLIRTFSSENIRAMITISDFVSFCLRFSFAFGISFQAPVVAIFLVKSGIIKRETLAKIRPYVVVFAFVISAVITPTPDALTQISLALPLIALWELGVLFSKLSARF